MQIPTGDNSMIPNQEPPLEDPNMNLDNNMPQDNMNGNENASKKEIQKLSGQLSQALNTYNQNQQQMDSELNKYVAGMIIPQAVKGMDETDKEEIINKLNKPSTQEQPQMQEPNPNDMQMNQQNPMQMESRHIDEIIDSILDNEVRKRNEKKITNKRLSKTNPFVTNR